MPYLILIVGLLIGLYALYRFFISANVEQVKALFMTAILVVIGIATLLLALTGRLPAAIAVLVAVVPIAISMHKKSKQSENPDQDIILSDDDVEIIEEDDVSGDDSEEGT